MKISLAWLYDHLNYDRHEALNETVVQTLLHKFSRTTAEIDHLERLELPLKQLSCARYESTATTANLFDPEHNRTWALPPRKDGITSSWYLIYHGDTAPRYATYYDVHGLREELLPAIYLTEAEQRGSWKEACDAIDYRITIDNQALSHRPDLWGHRGIAREIAAIMNWSLIPEASITTPLTCIQETTNALQSATCDRLVTVEIPSVTMHVSRPWMLLRLARVGGKGINAFVDTTNYVMFDLGQPLHVFDKEKLHGTVQMRAAHDKERLTLLDGTSIELSPQDCVVADEQRALSLAGIMGGKESGTTLNTRTLLLEGAHFKPGPLRQSATTHRIRTEASTRFEKGLDPELVTTAIGRYLHLLEQDQLISTLQRTVSCWGTVPATQTITLSHHFIEAIIGITIPSETIVALLTRLGLTTEQQSDKRDMSYTVHIPSYRQRDLTIPVDIVEELVRLMGYDEIPRRLPQRPMTPASYGIRARIRELRHLMALGCRMQEIYSYPLYDEAFLRELGYEPEDAVMLKNPVSEQWQRLVTSLVPHLLKAIIPNLYEWDEMRFFEINTTWHLRDVKPHEATKITFIVYAAHRKIDFYEGKRYVEQCAELVRMSLRWEAVSTRPAPWFVPGQTAALYHNDQCIGHAGIVASDMLSRIAPGSAFVAELDATALATYQAPAVTYTPLSKYPSVLQDISILAPYTLTVADLSKTLVTSHERIASVDLIDMFEQPSWPDKRALTFRITLVDKQATMTKELIDAIMQTIQHRIQTMGATIR